MARAMSLMVEVDAPTLAEFEKRFTVTKFSKAAAGLAGRVATEEELIAHLRACRPEVAVIEQEPFTRAVVAAAPGLKLVACARATPTNIDLAACREHGVAVSIAPGRNANAVVEMTIGFIICLARFIPQTHYGIRTRRLTVPPGTPLDHKDILWQNPALEQNPYVLYRGMEIEEKTLGLVGFGIIGRMLAPKAAALGMRVISYDPFVAAEDIARHGATKVESLDDLLAASDFVSLHAKPTPENRGMIGREQLGRMKREAYLINMARGTLIDQDALVRALREKVIAGAALDVFNEEPLCHDSPLLDLDNLVMTPHIAGATRDVIRHQSRLVAANVAAYCEGRELPHPAGGGKKG